MSIDLLHEQSVTISFARRNLIPKFNEKPISPATVYRWIDAGITAADGAKVRLEAVKVGRSLMTTKEAIQRFFDELTRRSNVQTTSANQLPSEAEAELLANGLLPAE